MRVLLVKPHPELQVARRLQDGFLHLEPLELEIVAGGVSDDDAVAILDLSVERSPLAALQEQLSRMCPDLVGLTGYSTNVSLVRELAGIFKRHNPAIKTVVGKVHATLSPKEYAIEDIDIVARGEGGTLSRELIPRIKQGTTPCLDGRALLTRDPEDVVDEIERLAEEHIYFVDDEMFLNVSRIRRIAELLIERGIKKQYISWSRSDTIVRHPEVFKLWREAGLRVVYVGLESMDESRLNEYEKRTDVETNRKAVSILRELQITLHASFVVHPDFTVEDFRRLEEEVMAVCPAEVSFTVFSPSPGTPLWHKHKHEFICDPYRFYDCMHSVLPTRLPLKQFYQQFGRLTNISLRANPMAANRIRGHSASFSGQLSWGRSTSFRCGGSIGITRRRNDVPPWHSFVDD